MLITLYGLAAIIVFAEFIYMALQSHKNQNIYHTLLFVVTIISNLGYLAVALSESLETIILANKISYLGGLFLPFFMLMTIAELCEIKIPKHVMRSLLFLCIILLCLIFSIGYSDIYYTNVEIYKMYGVSHIHKTYGPTHFLYYVLLICELGLSIGIIVKTLSYKKNFPKRTVGLLLFSLISSFLVYIIERLFHIPIKLMPFSYLIHITIYMITCRKMKIYDIASCVPGALDHLNEHGYLTFDNKLNFMWANAIAERYFPEIASARVDAPFTDQSTILYQEIVTWLQAYNKETNKEKMISIGEQYIKCTIHAIRNSIHKKPLGYAIEMVDDTKHQHYIQLLNHYNSTLKHEVKQKTAHIETMQSSIVTGMASMVESRDNSTGGHIRRTSECVRIFIDVLRPTMEKNLPEEFWTDVIRAAPMHDLGKIAVDDSILRKPGKYTDEEYAQMKKHSEKGAEIVAEVLKDINAPYFVTIAVNVAHYHHEKWNGTGYPKGLKEEEIPLEARIMALADVFDALVSKRCYKDAYTYDHAFKIIEESLGSHFDPTLGKIFISCRPQLEHLYMRKE